MEVVAKEEMEFFLKFIMGSQLKDPRYDENIGKWEAKEEKYFLWRWMDSGGSNSTRGKKDKWRTSDYDEWKST